MPALIAALAATLYYAWLVFGTELADRQSIRLCLDYGNCDDLRLFAGLAALPLALFLLLNVLRRVFAR
jgi:hypothetical protein